MFSNAVQMNCCPQRLPAGHRSCRNPPIHRHCQERWQGAHFAEAFHDRHTPHGMPIAFSDGRGELTPRRAGVGGRSLAERVPHLELLVAAAGDDLPVVGAEGTGEGVLLAQGLAWIRNHNKHKIRLRRGLKNCTVKLVHDKYKVPCAALVPGDSEAAKMICRQAGNSIPNPAEFVSPPYSHIFPTVIGNQQNTTPCLVPAEAAGREAGGEVPETEVGVPRRRQAELAVGRDLDVLDEAGVPGHPALRVAVRVVVAVRRELPLDARAVARRADHHVAGGEGGGRRGGRGEGGGGRRGCGGGGTNWDLR
eukprot:gene829-biopygen919